MLGDIHIALKTPVYIQWNTHVYCIEGPSEIFTQSAEVRLAVSVGTTCVYFGIIHVCLILSRLPVFTVEP